MGNKNGNVDILESLRKNLKSDIFKNKFFLTEKYIPETLLHRRKQIEEIVSLISPAIKGDKSNNLILYGSSGCGKSVVMKYIKEQFEKMAEENELPFKMIYLNCKSGYGSDTESKAIVHICNSLGTSINMGSNPSITYNKLFDILNFKKQNIIIIFDEINHLIKRSGDRVLYIFSRIDSELKESYVDIIGISNDIRFTENLDQNILSSLREKSIFFQPYDAPQIKDILLSRVEKAFHYNVLNDAVINKCAGISAQYGDVRKALDLLKTAGEIAEKENKVQITEKDIDNAESAIEKNKIFSIVRCIALHSKIVLLSVLKAQLKDIKEITTGDIYVIYKQISKEIGYKPLTQSSISNILSELDLLGIINSTLYNRGRYGRTRKINVYMNNKMLKLLYLFLEKELKL